MLNPITWCSPAHRSWSMLLSQRLIQQKCPGPKRWCACHGLPGEHCRFNMERGCKRPLCCLLHPAAFSRLPYLASFRHRSGQALGRNYPCPYRPARGLRCEILVVESCRTGTYIYSLVRRCRCRAKGMAVCQELLRTFWPFPPA